MKMRPVAPAALMLSGVMFIAALVQGSGAALAETEAVRTVNQFDDLRALGMRALLRAQELKTAHLYGRGFGLSMPERVSEDILVEGLWLFDHLNSLDGTSMSLFSYAAAVEHPNLDEEFEIFRAYMSEAAHKTIRYYDKVSRALADAVARVNAKAAEKGEFHVETIPSQPPTDDPGALALAGDGFNLGWSWLAAQNERSKLARLLRQHGYGQDRVFKLAADNGVNFISPSDYNLLEWIDVETTEGKYNWSRIDTMLARFKKHGIAIWLSIPSMNTGPPLWLKKRLGNKAGLCDAKGNPLFAWIGGNGMNLGVHHIRKANERLNLFNPEVSGPFARYIQQLIARVKGAGVRIMAIHLGPGTVLPSYAGPGVQARWKAWLEKNKLDPRERWDMDIDASDAPLPSDLRTVGVHAAGRRRLLMDFERWREDEAIEYFRVQVEAIRAVDPSVAICLSACEGGQGNVSMTGRADRRLVEELKVMPFGGWDDLRRCYSPAAWSAASAWVGLGNAHSRSSFSSYIHGAGTIATGLMPLARGFFRYGYAYVYPDMRLRWSSLGGWRRFHERAQGMAPEMLNTVPAPQAVILWSDTTNRLQAFMPDHIGNIRGRPFGTANYHKIGCLGWVQALTALSMSNDFITEEQVIAGRLQQYELLIMPAVQALPPAVAERIRQYVQKGGKVVATSAPALYDDDLQRKGVGQLADVFGADFERFLGASVIGTTRVNVPVTARPVRRKKGKKEDKEEEEDDPLRTLYCTYDRHPGAELLESFTTGETAVLMMSFGEGKAVLIGYPYGREYVFADSLGGGIKKRLTTWLDLLWPRIELVPRGIVKSETVPRPSGGDADEHRWWWTRKDCGYRDYVWETNSMPNMNASHRGIELAFRTAKGNPNIYLTILNREGANGYDPGVVHYEATSKEIELEVSIADVRHVYDLSLGCAVPFRQLRSQTTRKIRPVNFRTTIEPAMARMLVIASNDSTIRKYAGNRLHGRSDAELYRNVQALATDQAADDHVVIGLADIVSFLEERGPKGLSISAESPTYLQPAEQLAKDVKELFGRKARITRNSPRLGGFAPTFLEQPDILLGSHNESHYVVLQRIQVGHGNHTMRLPVMSSHTFPGPGRSVVSLLRPFRKGILEGANAEATKLFGESYAPPQLVIGASDIKGLEAGIENLMKLVRAAVKNRRGR